MAESKLLKCKQCSYTVEAEYINKSGEPKNGYWKLRNHYQGYHVGSYWQIMRSLPGHAPGDTRLQRESDFSYPEEEVEELNFG